MNEDIYSPDRQFKVSFTSYEMRMSHWVDQPCLTRVADDTCLFTIDTDNWSARSGRWLDDVTVELVILKYPGLIGCTIELNAHTQQGQATSPTASVAGTFSAVKDWVLALT
jgi:hypothetical protein